MTFTVGTSSGSRTGAGFNVSATGGSLTAGSGSRASSGELTQSATASMSGGRADFDFTWTAPTTPGTYTLRGAGNAVDGDRRTSGDAWALAANLTITVVCADDDGDGVTRCDGDCDEGDATVSPAATEVCDAVDQDCDDPDPDDCPEPRPDGPSGGGSGADADRKGGKSGCTVAPTPAGALALGLAALAAARRRRGGSGRADRTTTPPRP